MNTGNFNNDNSGDTKERVLLDLANGRQLVKSGNGCYFIKTIDKRIGIVYRGIDSKFDSKEIHEAIAKDKNLKL